MWPPINPSYLKLALKFKHTLWFTISMAKKKQVSGFTSDTKFHCPECEKEIPVGTGSQANLQWHIDLYGYYGGEVSSHVVMDPKIKGWALSSNYIGVHSMQQQNPSIHEVHVI
ncbi:uncharacterized protein LACBIDRAFT_322803 [Laccaria bicolor S238N-H82]|uniref:Predicted protein n=1 Tax=Laccaria bicolor (strain S238N-H82 / ATCC MYA-4686) TaxID=486041 RepID=B0CV50_LACBS|nr:uncharacterized protein LACBIDRAFT_322803 [Laccaria bicolor S238N-H82]EDR13267.1 predicted protein [Laccaria bicolor S238N-H82]|eukprot:XP_001875765.1 predicted protein [Laccaria bicolor S238N-H82]